MNLVDRYLRAVRDHLPRPQQDDIINELADSIHSKMEDQEAALGRPLVEEEQIALLRGFGHPLAVAARYRGDDRSLTFGRQLIGPELFPTYLKILGLNFAVTLIVLAIVFIAAGAVWSGLGGFITPFAIQFIAVTAVFVAVDRYWLRDPNWDPRKVTSTGSDIEIGSLDGIANQLISNYHPRIVPITTAMLEIGLLGVALAAWLSIGLPQQIGPLAPGAGWRDLYGAVTVAIVAGLSIPVVNLVRPTWTRFRVAGHIAIDVATIAIGAVSLALGSWVVLVDPASAPADAPKLVDLVNGIIRVSIAATIVLTAVNVAFEVRRLVRMSRAQAAER
jgi:hypothetical protein